MPDGIPQEGSPFSADRQMQEEYLLMFSHFTSDPKTQTHFFYVRTGQTQLSGKSKTAVSTHKCEKRR